MARASNIQVVLLRSGRTAWDEQRRVQGRTELPLSEAGRAGVLAEIHRLTAAIPAQPSTVLAAPDESSRETAVLWAGVAHAKIRTVPELATMSLGLWEGLLESEIEHRFPAACREWRENPSTILPPEGEPFADAEMRIRVALSEILDRASGKPTAIVCRPIPFAMALCWLSARPARDLWTIVEQGPHSAVLNLDREIVSHLLEDLKAGA